MKPGKYSALTIGDCAVNHVSPRPLTLMPKSVPLRAMMVTMVLPSTLCPAAVMDLQPAMTGLRTLKAFSPSDLMTSNAVALSLAVLAM